MGMNIFKKQDGDYKKSYGKRDFGPRENKEMFDAVCSKCGKSCQVPFRPNGKKPIFCSNCFEKELAGNPRSYDEPRANFAPPRSQMSNPFEELNQKLDRIIALLSEKREERPKQDY